MHAAICTRTRTRSEACGCSTCARGATPNAKHLANKRDVFALLDLIAGCVDCHPSQPHGDATWGHVGDIAHLRERLVEIAVGFGLGPDGDEQSARHRIEEALCTDDENVGEALIDAM
jgi:hypothetical protein